MTGPCAGVLYAKYQIGGQQTASPGVEVESVCPKKMSPLPEGIKIVNKTHTVGDTGGGKPGVKAEQPAETAYPSAAGGGGPGDKSTHLQLTKEAEELEEVQLQQLRLLFGDVIGADVDDEPVGLWVGRQDVGNSVHYVDNGGSRERQRERPPHPHVPDDGIPEDQRGERRCHRGLLAI